MSETTVTAHSGPSTPDGRCRCLVRYPWKSQRTRSVMIVHAQCRDIARPQYDGQCSPEHQAATARREEWEIKRERWAALNPGQSIEDFPETEPGRPYVTPPGHGRPSPFTPHRGGYPWAG